jgi:hypothetical protein
MIVLNRKPLRLKEKRTLFRCHGEVESPCYILLINVSEKPQTGLTTTGEVSTESSDVSLATVCLPFSILAGLFFHLYDDSSENATRILHSGVDAREDRSYTRRNITAASRFHRFSMTNQQRTRDPLNQF